MDGRVESRMSAPAFRITAGVFAAGMVGLMVLTESVRGGLFMAGFVLWPLLVSLGLSVWMIHGPCQKALVVGTVLYGLWMGFVCLDAFVWHVDAQSAVGLVVAMVVALPVMLVVWLFAFVRWMKRRGVQ